MARSRTKSAKKSSAVLAFGIILVITGLGLAASALDLSNLRPLEFTFDSPIGTFTTDSFTEEEEKRLFIGIIVASFGALLIKIGK